jgi:hypothetical protein
MLNNNPVIIYPDEASMRVEHKAMLERAYGKGFVPPKLRS